MHDRIELYDASALYTLEEYIPYLGIFGFFKCAKIQITMYLYSNFSY